MSHSDHLISFEGTRETWDTSYVKPQDRFSFFREDICQAYAFSPEETSGRGIDARLERIILPKGIVCKAELSPNQMVRTKTNPSKMQGEFFGLHFQLSGDLNLNAAGLRYYIQPGDIYTVDHNNELDVEIKSNIAAVAILFDKSLFRGSLEFDPVKSLRTDCIGPLRDLMQIVNDRYHRFL